MGVSLTKDSIDLGLVVRNAEACLAFYRDVLGFEHAGTMPMGGGSVMERLQCGTSTIKLVSLGDKTPAASNPPGGLGGATGMRYWTISVSNLEEIVAACDAAGAKVIWTPREIRPGVRVGMVEDPDGNWVEFLEIA
jgi:catechol 2,3-dioxygenase-like lactoylglutathione lyase family enzyme